MFGAGELLGLDVEQITDVTDQKLQHHHIDVFFTVHTDNKAIPVIVENKTHSSRHSNQLET